MTVVGHDKLHPVWIGTEREKAEILQPWHYGLFDVWQKFNVGMGLPGGKPWDQYDPDFIDMIVHIESYYQANKSVDAAKIKLAEASIEVMIAAAKSGRRVI